MTSSVVPTSQSMFKVIPMSKLSDYDMYKQLGQGTFGVVTKARQKKSNKLVAIKKFIVSDKKEGFPITAFREITIMKKLKNINVLQIVDMIHDDDEDSFFTVSPYISSDLNGLLNNPRIELSLPQIKCIMKQLLLGMDYIHQSGYLHRDIKTANILLDQFGIVKIADFGLARLFHGDPPSCENSPPGGGKYEYTGLVVTRWYRSPELLLGDRKYTTAVDMWGIGCVFAEMFTKRPILEGQSDIHQAEIIFKLLGSPTSENFPNCHLINRHNINLKTNYPRTLEAQFGTLMTKDALSLLSGLLTLDPLTRFNAIKCLNSDFFTNEPVPCSTQQLSNFEESHESDVKRFKEESKSMKKNPATSYNSSGIELTDKMASNKGVYKQQTQPITTKNVMSSNINLSMNSASSLNHSRYGVDVEMNREPSVSALADYSVEQDTEDVEKGTMKSALNDDIKNTPIKPVATTGIEIPTKPSDHTADSGNGNSKRTTRLPTNQINQIQSYLHSSNTRGTKRSYESDYRYSKDNDYGYYDPKFGYIDRPLGNSGYYSNRTYDYDGPYFENKRVSGANNRDKSRFEFEQRDNYKGRSNARRMDSSFSASGKELFSSSNTSGSSGLKELSKLMHQKQKQETRKKTEQDEPNGKQTEP